MLRGALCFMFLALFLGPTAAFGNGAERSTNSTEASTPQPGIGEQEFQESLRAIMPMVPEQIKAFREDQDARARALNGTPPPRMVSASRQLALEPGAVPQIVQITPGYVTTVVFTDSTGAPWPITSATAGSDKLFQVLRPEKLEPGNLLTVSALEGYAHSNLVVTLLGHDYPVVLHLQTAGATGKNRVCDALVAFRADKRGPKAESPFVGPQIEPTVNKTMLSFLDNVPPSGAARVELSPVTEGLAAWSFEGKLYVRSRHSMLWPAWTAASSGTGGYRLYEMPQVPSVMISRDGEPITISVVQ